VTNGRRKVSEKISEFDYTSDHPGVHQIMHAINEIQFMERMKLLAPGIAKALMEAGVKFPVLAHERKEASEFESKKGDVKNEK
jgi:hypothetical protein